jgi:hypothetical protein
MIPTFLPHPKAATLTEAEARDAERALCVRQVRAQCDDYRIAARARKENGTYCFDKQRRGQFMTAAIALEQMALLLEGKQ